jgi:hypothetical protein
MPIEPGGPDSPLINDLLVALEAGAAQQDPSILDHVSVIRALTSRDPGEAARVFIAEELARASED